MHEVLRSGKHGDFCANAKLPPLALEQLLAWVLLTLGQHSVLALDAPSLLQRSLVLPILHRPRRPRCNELKQRKLKEVTIREHTLST